MFIDVDEGKTIDADGRVNVATANTPIVRVLVSGPLQPNALKRLGHADVFRGCRMISVVLMPTILGETVGEG